MKILLTTLNSKFIHTNLAIRYLKSYTKDLVDADIREYNRSRKRKAHGKYGSYRNYQYLIEDIIENIEGKKEIIDAHSHIGIDYKYGTSKLDEYVEFCKKNGITKANVMPQPNPAYVINGKIVPCMTWQYKDGKITYETYDNTNKNPYKYINYFYYQQCKNVKEMNINFQEMLMVIILL